jgi:hypothetical protein
VIERLYGVLMRRMRLVEVQLFHRSCVSELLLCSSLPVQFTQTLTHCCSFVQVVISEAGAPITSHHQTYSHGCLPM